MTPEQEKLVKRLKTARYKVLVAIRPVAPAREAFNLIVAELAQDLPELAELKLEEPT